MAEDTAQPGPGVAEPRTPERGDSSKAKAPSKPEDPTTQAPRPSKPKTTKSKAKDTSEIPNEVDFEEGLQKAIAASQATAKQAAQQPNDEKYEKELLKVLALSKQTPPAPAPGPVDDDEDMKRIIEESLKEAAAHADRLEQSKRGEREEEQIINDSKETERRERQKRIETGRMTDDEHYAFKFEAMWENRAEFVAKEKNRASFQSREDKRTKEIADEEREERLAQQARAAAEGRTANFRSSRDVDDLGDADVRAAIANSLGDQGSNSDPTLDETGWSIDKMPPAYHEISKSKNKEILDDKKWTTSSRDISQVGQKIRITPEILSEMKQWGYRQNVMMGEEHISASEKAQVPAYKKTGSKAEKALAAVIKSSAPTKKTPASKIVDTSFRENHQHLENRVIPQTYRGTRFQVRTEADVTSTRDAQIETRQASGRVFRRIPEDPRRRDSGGRGHLRTQAGISGSLS